MIRKPNNWENVQAFSDRPKLPLGAYVCKIEQTRIQDTDYGFQLCLLFDIAEGEHAGYFRRDFAANMNQDKKWRGLLRVWLPLDDGSEKDELTKRTFKGMVTAFEKSNPGYRWDWNENSLTGKTIGILFRNEEWSYNGQQGWAVRPFRAISADSVREGSYTLPKDKPLSGRQSSAATTYQSAPAGYTEVADDDLPF